MKRASTVLMAVAMAISGIVAALALIEGGFRAYYWFNPGNAPGFFWEPHPEFGWAHIANRQGPFHDELGEFRTDVRINSQGLRDVEHSYEKAPGVFRILVLGDSYIEGMQVELEQTFARVLEEQLNAESSVRVEVINGGVSGFGTDNELLFLRHEGHKYHPDLVLLGLFTGNDVRDNYAPFNRMVPKAGIYKPVFSLDERGVLQMKPGPPPPPPLAWWRWFHVLRYLGERLGLRMVTARQWPGLPPPKDPTIPWVPADMFVHAPKAPLYVEEAFRLTDALVRAISAEASADGAKFVVALLSGPWVHYDEDWKRFMARFPFGSYTWDRQRPRRLLNAQLSEAGIPSIDLFDEFEAAKKGERLFFRSDPHFTRAGHRVAAQAVARYLLSHGVVPRGTHRADE